MKFTIVTSKFYLLKCSYKTLILYENEKVEFKESKILEGWFDIFVNQKYNGTITKFDFYLNFRIDNLIMDE